MSSGQEWWANKEAEMRREAAAREQRWQDYRLAHYVDPALPEVLARLRAEFDKAEAVRFTLERR